MIERIVNKRKKRRNNLKKRKMQPFKKFAKKQLNENYQFNLQEYLDNSLGIPRNRMPQVPDDNLDDFLLHFKSRWNVKKKTIPLKKLKPTQGEINMDKVKSMLRKKKKPYFLRKFIVSKDYRIADGHHAHVAGMLKDPNHPVTVYQVSVTGKKMLEILNKLKITYREE